MKRKFLVALLILLMLPVATVFSACKNKGYNLNNLKNDFQSIAAETTNFEVDEKGRVVVDYSSTDLSYWVEHNTHYGQVEKYNEVYENAMAFVFEYIDECSNNGAVKDAGKKDQIQKDIQDIKISIKNVDRNINLLAEMLKLIDDEKEENYNPVCAARYETLLRSYNNLYYNSIKLHNSLSDIYFNNILQNSNPNVYEIGLENFDVNIIVNRFDARRKCQIASLSQNYVEMFMNNQLANDIITGKRTITLDEFDYKTNVNAIKRDFVESEEVFKITEGNKKEAYYNLSIQAYNMQEILKNDVAKFMDACNRISYADMVDNDSYETATAEEKLSFKIIEDRLIMLETYNVVLINMLNIGN